jgi:carbon monoxide dehydrogenase subunit G
MLLVCYLLYAQLIFAQGPNDFGEYYNAANNNEWEIDFYALSQKYADKVRLTISAAVYDNIGTTSIVNGDLKEPAEDGSTQASEELDPRFGVQTGTIWLFYTNKGKTGLYQGNGGSRTFGVLDAKKDQVITIEVTEQPSIKSGAVELFAQTDNSYIYIVNEDCNVVFNLARYNVISNISVRSSSNAEYIVKFVNEKGEKVKNDVRRSGIVGKPVSLLPSDTEPIILDGRGKLLFKEADNTEHNVVKKDGSTVITVVYREAEKYYAVLNCMAGSTLLYRFNDTEWYWFYEGDELILHPSRCYGKDGVYYTTPATTWNGTQVKFPGTFSPVISGGKTYYIATQSYVEDETVAYYSDFERLALPKEDAGDGTGLGQLEGTVNSWYSFRGTLFERFSGGRAIRLDVGSYVWTEPIAKAGTYKVTIYGRNDSSVAAETPYILGLRSVEGNITWFTDLAIPSWAAAVTGQSVVENVIIPAGSSLVIKNTEETNLISLDDITLIKQSSDTPVSTFAQTVKVTGNGTVGYNGISIRNSTQVLSMNEGTSATFTITPDANSSIKSVKLNGTDVTSDVINYQYTISNINSDNNLVVEFEAIPPTTYTLGITATGNGSATYNNTEVRGKTQSFTVNEGTSATISFTPDTGYRIATVKLNGMDITSNVADNKYTISNITANTTLAVTFEAIPPTTYTMSITVSGNGYVTYDGNTIRGKTSPFTIVEGTNVILKFTADDGNRLKSVKVNGKDVTSFIINNQYTVSDISANISIEVAFEAIPTYSLNILTSGNGNALYNGTTIRNQSNSFTLQEGSSAVITFTPDANYRIKSVKVNNVDVTSQVANGQITIGNIIQDTNVEVTFEEIPPTTYSLTITAKGNGTVTYDGNVVRGGSSTFTVVEGSYATIQITADESYRLKSVILDGKDVTGNVANNQYTTAKITANTTLEVEFVELVTDLAYNGVSYKVVSYDDKTVNVASGNYGLTLTVPATFEAKDNTWTVVGIDSDALANATELAAVIWETEVIFNNEVSNPNLLLYVKDAQYAPSDIQNVIVGDQAENIVLKDAAKGNNFYCPKAFTAKRISYEHHYNMTTGYNTCQGWETIALPFDVTTVLNQKGVDLVPYASWQQGSSQRPFWLYQMTSNGWQAATAIQSNTPYIISMPNNVVYQPSYNQTGYIQFLGSNVEVKASSQLNESQYGRRHFYVSYQQQSDISDIYALNVNNQWSSNTDVSQAEGSAFIRNSRTIHPFEAYMTIEGSNAPWMIPIFDNGMPTNIVEIERMRNVGNEDWYDLQGRKLQGEPKQDGIYIRNGKKIKK